MAAEKKLILFNGRALALHRAPNMPWESNTGEGWHLYVAAYSKADAVRLIEEITGSPVSFAERKPIRLR